MAGLRPSGLSEGSPEAPEAFLFERGSRTASPLERWVHVWVDQANRRESRIKPSLGSGWHIPPYLPKLGMALALAGKTVPESAKGTGRGTLKRRARAKATGAYAAYNFRYGLDMPLTIYRVFVGGFVEFYFPRKHLGSVDGSGSKRGIKEEF